MVANAPIRESVRQALERAGFQALDDQCLCREIRPDELPEPLRTMRLQATVHLDSSFRAICAVQQGPDDELLEAVLAQGPGVRCQERGAPDDLVDSIARQLTRQLHWLAGRGSAERAWLFH